MTQTFDLTYIDATTGERAVERVDVPLGFGLTPGADFFRSVLREHPAIRAKRLVSYGKPGQAPTKV